MRNHFCLIVRINKQDKYTRGEINIKECLIDSECVPSSCCHASSCVPISKKPACDKILCSMECSSILDCGNAFCSCVNNKCEVVMNIE